MAVKLASVMKKTPAIAIVVTILIVVGFAATYRVVSKDSRLAVLGDGAAKPDEQQQTVIARKAIAPSDSAAENQNVYPTAASSESKVAEPPAGTAVGNTVSETPPLFTAISNELLDSSTLQMLADNRPKRFRAVTVNSDALRQAIRSNRDTEVFTFELFGDVSIETVPHRRREVSEGPAAGSATWMASAVGDPYSSIHVSIFPNGAIYGTFTFKGQDFMVVPVNRGPHHLIAEIDMTNVRID